MAIRFLSTQYIDGSLGIGTANPQDQLHLASSLPSIRLEDTDDNYYHRIRGNGSNLIIVADAGNAANNSSIRFQVDADEKMRITSDGNVGINITPASSVALDVKEPDASNDLILGLTAGTGSRAQIRSVVQTSTESALSFHTTLSSFAAVSGYDNTNAELNIFLGHLVSKDVLEFSGGEYSIAT